MVMSRRITRAEAADKALSILDDAERGRAEARDKEAGVTTKPAFGRWTRVDEHDPPSLVPVLAWSEQAGGWVEGFWHFFIRRFYSPSRTVIPNVTHWMPGPPRPEEADQ
jgi:hypothetical protein